MDAIEVRKLVPLGYLDPALAAAKGPALNYAAEAYLSDKLAAEVVSGASARAAL